MIGFPDTETTHIFDAAAIRELAKELIEFIVWMRCFIRITIPLKNLDFFRHLIDKRD